MEPTSTRRNDIDGLRGVAVLAVVFYHFAVPPFSGGFIGVDVFFVISGYVISGILIASQADHTFSYLGFWVRRAKRILPALFLVLIVSTMAGYVLLSREDYAGLAHQTWAALFGVSNFYFWDNTGYFDPAAEMLPLLHTWSLGIEMQFYLLWPLAMAFLACLGRWRLTILLLGVGASFLIGAVVTFEKPLAAFYLPVTRAWELGLGALVAMLPALRSGGGLANLAGGSLILFSALLYDGQTPFPGTAALIPCMGTALIVWPKSQPDIVSRLLSTPPLVAIGLISYSLYLWHWPVLVFFRHFNNGLGPDGLETVALITVTVGVAVLTWTYVEKPFRTRRLQWRSPALWGGGLAAAIVLTGAVAAPTALPGRAGPLLPGRDAMFAWDCPFSTYFTEIDEELCTFGAAWGEADHHVLLWGDSHAAHYAPIVAAALRDRSDISVALTRRSCPAIYGGSVSRIDTRPGRGLPNCYPGRMMTLALLAAHPEIELVLAAGYWHVNPATIYTTGSRPALGTPERGIQLLEEAAIELADVLMKNGQRLHILGDFPVWPSDPLACRARGQPFPMRDDCPSKLSSMSEDYYLSAVSGAHIAFQSAANKSPTLSYSFPGERMCAGTCRTTIHGEFIYRDTDHLRRDLSSEIYDELANMSGVHAALMSF